MDCFYAATRVPLLVALVPLLLAAGPCGNGKPREPATPEVGGTLRKAPSRPLPAGPSTIKLTTWNLQWLGAEPGSGVVKRTEGDYARLRKYAERLDADVIALQEVDGEAAAARVFDPGRYAFHVASGSGPARTGFAYKKRLAAERLPDVAELDVGGLRAGADLSLMLGDRPLRLLSVHLKSGCFDAPLERGGNACRKLREQLPRLEAWIDARAAEGTLFAVLGDFNRRLFARPDEPFWREIDDGEPPEADLWSPTAGARPRCWNAEYAEFIDHLVLGRSTGQRLVPGSFAQLEYDAADQPYKSLLSDHCALSITLSAVPQAKHPQETATARAPAPPASAAPSATTSPAIPVASGPIKGNVGRKNKRLYHLPSCPDYARVVIDPEQGERLFASEAEASAAGFTKAGNCP